jgi:hypothetical protein
MTLGIEEVERVRRALDALVDPVGPAPDLKTLIERSQTGRLRPETGPTHRRRVPLRGPAAALAGFLAVIAVGLPLWWLVREGGLSSAPESSQSPPTTQSEVSVTQATTLTDVPTEFPPQPVTLLDTPLVVQEVPRGPAPQFDTATLGELQQLAPFGQLSVEDLRLDAIEFPLIEGAPIVALGEIEGLRAFRHEVVALGYRHTCDWGIGTKDTDHGPLGACAFGRNPRPEVTALVRSGGVAETTQVFWSGLSAEVSVVALSDATGSVRLWQRPVGGVAVFLVTTAPDSPLDLTAYDAGGSILRQTSTEDAGTNQWPSERVTVPQVVGLTFADASQALAEVGLEGLPGGEDDGIVGAQFPGAGASLQAGESVNLYP